MNFAFIIAMYSLSRIILIWGFDLKQTLNKKNCWRLSLLSVFTILLLKINVQLGFLIYLLGTVITCSMYLKRFQSWISMSILICLRYMLLVSSWILSFDVPRIFFGKDYFNSFDRMLGFHIIQQLILLLIVLLIKRVFIKRSLFSRLYIVKGSHKKLGLGYIFFISFFSFIRQFRSYPQHTDSFFLSITMMLTFTIITLIILYFYSEKQNELSKSKIIQQLTSIENETYEKVKKFEHDYKNILIVLQDYLENEQHEDAKEYLSSLLEYSKSKLDIDFYTDIYKIPNTEIQNYLSSFLFKCKNNRIPLSISVIGEPFFISINPIDIVRSISIISENALEACASERNPQIDIKFEYTNKRVDISISNSCTKQVDLREIINENVTTKQDHTGMGLNILKKILRENNSDLELSWDKQLFLIFISIPK